MHMTKKEKQDWVKALTEAGDAYQRAIERTYIDPSREATLARVEAARLVEVVGRQYQQRRAQFAVLSREELAGDGDASG
jgi:hypothetical protein